MPQSASLLTQAPWRRPRHLARAVLSLSSSLALALALCGPAAAAEPAPDGAAPAADAPPPAVEAPLRLAAPGVRPWSGTSAQALRPAGAAFALPRLSIVEVPADIVPGTGPRKLRHALSIRAEAPQRMLRSMGIEATDCATRIRVPSRFKTDADGNRSFDLAAHLGLACRF